MSPVAVIVVTARVPVMATAPEEAPTVLSIVMAPPLPMVTVGGPCGGTRPPSARATGVLIEALMDVSEPRKTTRGGNRGSVVQAVDLQEGRGVGRVDVGVQVAPRRLEHADQHGRTGR